MPEYKAIDKLFYSFHSEFEAIVMDMIAEKTDKRIMDTMFEDFDCLQEEYHEKLHQKRRSADYPDVDPGNEAQYNIFRNA